MENFFTRYKNPLVLMAVLVIQVIALATQIKRPENALPGRYAGSGGTRLIRVWTVTAITPFEAGFVATGHFIRDTWRNYLDLHDVRRQNRELQQEISRLRVEQVKLRNDADQDRRLEALLDFKERYAGPTIAAQVIGASGSEQSRVIYIDKGSRAGLRQDMAVITPDGVVGKVRDVYPFSSQVLMINDRDSGAGVILESSRLQGILRGKEMGEIRISDILSDEKVDIGERVITSGGDRVYPKGLPVGTVTSVGPDPDASPFLSITIKPAANLDRLEEVLVVTKIAEEAPPAVGDEPSHRAAEILAGRLPTVPKKPEEKKLGEKKPEEKKSGESHPATAARPAPAATPPGSDAGDLPRPSGEGRPVPQPGLKKPGAVADEGASRTKSGAAAAIDSAPGAAAKKPEVMPKKPAEKSGKQPDGPQAPAPTGTEKPPR